ncbi:MAG: signal peptidase I [Patescibacteria group bacterium]
MEEKKEENLNDNFEIQEKGLFSKIALFFLEIIKVALLAAITIGLVRYFLFKPFYVKGSSMEPNFYERDYLIIDELSYRLREPARGEVIVFNSPVNSDYYLKRIIGLPGERVIIENNTIVIKNKENPTGFVVEENYINEDTGGSTNITLGENQYFVLGDNRDSSFDSRSFGAIDSKAVVGKVWVRGFPFDRINIFEKPIYNN